MIHNQTYAQPAAYPLFGNSKLKYLSVTIPSSIERDFWNWWNLDFDQMQANNNLHMHLYM